MLKAEDIQENYVIETTILPNIVISDMVYVLHTPPNMDDQYLFSLKIKDFDQYLYKSMLEKTEYKTHDKTQIGSVIKDNSSPFKTLQVYKKQTNYGDFLLDIVSLNKKSGSRNINMFWSKTLLSTLQKTLYIELGTHVFSSNPKKISCDVHHFLVNPEKTEQQILYLDSESDIFYSLAIYYTDPIVFMGTAIRFANIKNITYCTSLSIYIQ